MFSLVGFEIAPEEDRASINISIYRRSHTPVVTTRRVFFFFFLAAALTVTGLEITNKQLLQSGCGGSGRCRHPFQRFPSFLGRHPGYRQM